MAVGRLFLMVAVNKYKLEINKKIMLWPVAVGAFSSNVFFRMNKGVDSHGIHYCIN